MENILNKELNSNQFNVKQLQPQKRYFNLNSKQEALFEKLPAFTNRVANSDRNATDKPSKVRIPVLKKSARQNAQYREIKSPEEVKEFTSRHQYIQKNSDQIGKPDGEAPINISFFKKFQSKKEPPINSKDIM